MDKELTELEMLITEWFNGVEIFTKSDLIRKAADLYDNHNNKLPQSLKDVFSRCSDYIKGNQSADADEYILVEELSGYLGEYFAD